MANRSDRGSGQPDDGPGRKSPQSRMGPDPRNPSRPAVQDHRVHRPDTRLYLTWSLGRRIILATREPSTQDHGSHGREQPSLSRVLGHPPPKAGAAGTGGGCPRSLHKVPRRSSRRSTSEIRGEAEAILMKIDIWAPTSGVEGSPAVAGWRAARGNLHKGGHSGSLADSAFGIAPVPMAHRFPGSILELTDGAARFLTASESTLGDPCAD
jgi:hypothetical protein